MGIALMMCCECVDMHLLTLELRFSAHSFGLSWKSWKRGLLINNYLAVYIGVAKKEVYSCDYATAHCIIIY